jgi:transposase
MLTLPSSVRVFVGAKETDLRNSFNGLSVLVESRFGQDALRGDLFVFFNRRRTQVRCLFWDRTGYCIIAKKLARGTFHFVYLTEQGEPYVEMEAAELALILAGIDLSSAKRFKRWRPTKETTVERPNYSCPPRSRHVQNNAITTARTMP